jgi:hypothetical protein
MGGGEQWYEANLKIHNRKGYAKLRCWAVARGTLVLDGRVFCNRNKLGFIETGKAYSDDVCLGGVKPPPHASHAARASGHPPAATVRLQVWWDASSSHAKSGQKLIIIARLLIRQRMPSSFVSLVLVVLCAAAYMHFTQPPSPAPPPPTKDPPLNQPQSPPPASKQESLPKQILSAEARRVQSIIDEQVREEGGPEKIRRLGLVSACVELGNHQFRARSQRVLLLLMRFLRDYESCFLFLLRRCI